MTMIQTLASHQKKRQYLKVQMMMIQTLESHRQYKMMHQRF